MLPRQMPLAAQFKRIRNLTRASNGFIIVTVLLGVALILSAAFHAPSTALIVEGAIGSTTLLTSVGLRVAVHALEPRIDPVIDLRQRPEVIIDRPDQSQASNRAQAAIPARVLARRLQLEEQAQRRLPIRMGQVAPTLNLAPKISSLQPVQLAAEPILAYPIPGQLARISRHLLLPPSQLLLQDERLDDDLTRENVPNSMP